MKKHKKVIIGVVLLFITLVAGFTYKTVTEVFAVSAAPDTCTKEDEKALVSWYDPTYIIEDGYLQISVGHGSFKLVELSAASGVIQSSYTKDKDGYILIDGKEAVAFKDNPIKIKVGSYPGQKVTFKLALSKTTKKPNCLSYHEFNDKKDEEGEKIYTFGMGPIEADLPRTHVEPIRVENKSYNGICKAIRNGDNSDGKVSSEIFSMYDNSSAAIAHYKTIVGDCWEPTVFIEYSESNFKTLIEAAIVSWNAKNSGNVTDSDGNSSWSINFNDVMNKAKAKGNSFFSKGGKFYTDSSARKEVDKGKFSLSCKYQANSPTDFSNLNMYKKVNGKKEYNIDANTDYFYSYDETVGKANYKWNYTEGSNASKVETVDVCKRICEEAVEVKYGPPIASKAGLCFEYQIQVTSRVRCSTEVTGKPPKKPGICDPIPYCNNTVYYQHQAGPNEEFEDCVNKCDGGKYSKKCSNKCYDKVYGKNKGKAKKTDYINDTVATKKLSGGVSFEGKYYWSGNSIKWSGANTYARYYLEHEYDRTISDAHSYHARNGFKWNDNGCTNRCYFSGCSQNQYLNREDATKDYSYNITEYNNAVKKCKASASCTTKSAVFKISVNYRDGDNNKKTIEFPYSTKKDTLNSSDKEDGCKSNPNLEANKGEHILLNYGGCYKNCGNGNEYHARWSFPGTWINNKTGEISYKPVNSPGWTESDKKFCIPLDAKNQNTKWWNYYYNHLVSGNSRSSVKGETYEKICDKSGSSNSITNKNSISASDIEDWNILGETTNFGYFGWDLEFKCFYALNDNPSEISKTSSSTSQESICKPEPPNYKIRSVDLENIFPDPNGKELSTYSTTGRAPGFNWSSYVDNIVSKNSGYGILPTLYTQQVQKLGYKVYNDENLDYYFYITASQLQKLQKETKGNEKKYTSFNGKSEIRSNGVISYRSDLIRTEGNFKSKKVPNENVLGCNNIDNYAANQCAVISGR